MATKQTIWQRMNWLRVGTTREEQLRMIRLGAGFCAWNALVIVALVATQVFEPLDALDAIAWGLCGWFLMSRQSRLAAGATLALTAVSWIMFASAPADGHPPSLLFLAIFVQTFRATLRYYAPQPALVVAASPDTILLPDLRNA